MLNVSALLLCFALLTSINLSYTKPHGHVPIPTPQPELDSSDVLTPDVDCGNNRQFNSKEKKCDCKFGFKGENCEHKYTESRRCRVIPSQGLPRQQKTDCPPGEWCVPDNINCFFYLCEKNNSQGWCIPHAKNSPSDPFANGIAQAEGVYEDF